MDLQKGDRVEYLYGVFRGFLGTVKFVNDVECLVEFDEEHPLLHNGGGTGDLRTLPNRGLWCELKTLKKRLGD